jgi:hypothetical protein
MQTVLSFEFSSSYVKTKHVLKLHCVRQKSSINPSAELLWYYSLSISNNVADFEIAFNCNSTNSVNFVIYVLSSFFLLLQNTKQ